MVTTVSPERSVERLGVVAAETPPPVGVERLNVLLIKPSKYDDHGYVMQFLRGVLPSNTLATLAGLTEEVTEKRELGDIDVRTVMLDEVVQTIDARKLARRYNRGRQRAVVGLVGVQTNQWPRAADLGREFVAAGMPVMIGGFHVSGAIAMSTCGIPAECQQAMDDGITLVKGEVEMVWGDLLRDALHGRLQPYYEVKESPDISEANIPVVDPRLQKRYAFPFMGTIDAGRGCPFSCKFCTIINVQGRKMRCRSAEAIKQRIRENARLGINFYFFTDDNMARNPQWEQIFDALIDLRENEGIPTQFMMQVDVVAYRIKNFVDKARRAGCLQVFIGMESINPENLKASGKRQNNADDYHTMINTWRERGVSIHVGYIIGFPFDTVESVREDVRRLRDDLGVDQASFFMLTPLPGSQDHAEMLARGDWMGEDYNDFDSFHATIDHPRMSGEDWFELFQQVWHDFYTVDAMKNILNRATDSQYWGLFRNFLWYRYSAFIESTHPMICGFFKRKNRVQRRPGYAVDGWFQHTWMRIGDYWRWLRLVGKMYLEMQEVWLGTRGRQQWDDNLEGLRRRYARMHDAVGTRALLAGGAVHRQWQSVRSGAEEALDRANQAGKDAGACAGRIYDDYAPAMPRTRGLLARLNPLKVRSQTRRHLDAYWHQTFDKLRRGRFYRINPFSFVINLLRDMKLCTRFGIAMLTGWR